MTWPRSGSPSATAPRGRRRDGGGGSGAGPGEPPRSRRAAAAGTTAPPGPLRRGWRRPRGRAGARTGRARRRRQRGSGVRAGSGAPRHRPPRAEERARGERSRGCPSRTTWHRRSARPRHGRGTRRRIGPLAGTGSRGHRAGREAALRPAKPRPLQSETGRRDPCTAPTAARTRGAPPRRHGQRGVGRAEGKRTQCLLLSASSLLAKRGSTSATLQHPTSASTLGETSPGAKNRTKYQGAMAPLPHAPPGALQHLAPQAMAPPGQQQQDQGWPPSWVGRRQQPSARTGSWPWMSRWHPETPRHPGSLGIRWRSPMTNKRKPKVDGKKETLTSSSAI